MKTVLIYILLILPILNFGQTRLEGKYCVEPNMYAKCFTFNNDSLFEYFFIGDLGSYTIKGSGKYNMTSDLLTLFFENDDTLETSFVIRDSIENKSDSITLSFIVIDKDLNEPLPFAEIKIITKNKSYKTSTDFNGFAKLILSKSQKFYTISTNYVSYKPCSFKVKADKSKEIKISFVSLHGLIENGAIWKYRIKGYDPHKIELMNIADKYSTIFYKY